MPGPLQVKVASPNFTDWQNIDWSALSPLMSSASISPEGFTGPSMSGDEIIYDFGVGYVRFHYPDYSSLLIYADSWHIDFSPQQPLLHAIVR